MPYDPDRHGPARIVGPGFHERVYRLVALVPRGRVTTYGDIARALGSVRVARHVGYALAALPAARRDVPWHRVVDGRGRLHRPAEDPGGAEQRRRLRREGIEVDDSGRVIRFAARRALPAE
jgi:methylated-DNA-protein-cysteine methyltransferase-like protein